MVITVLSIFSIPWKEMFSKYKYLAITAANYKRHLLRNQIVLI